MSQGRKPLPTQLKIVKGTQRTARENRQEPKPPGHPVRRPAGMSKNAAAHWQMICRQLKSAGMITTIDVTALMVYCEAFAAWREATDKIAEHGAIVENADGWPVRSPYLLVAQRAFDQMKAMMTEFGMTPSSRTRIKVVVPDKKDNDPWDDL